MAASLIKNAKTIGLPLALMAILSIFTGLSAAQAEPLDLHEDGSYCSALNAKVTATPLKYVTPTWAKEQRLSVVSEPTGLDAIAHNLNSQYLRSMVDSTYLRLSAAKEAGLDLNNYKVAFANVAEFCGKPDASGHGLALEAGRIARLPGEVEADFSGFSLIKESLSVTSDKYLRRLVVASIETRRIQRVLTAIKAEISYVKPTGERLSELHELTKIHLRRLVRLQHRYPVLVTVGTFIGAASLEIGVENSFGAELSITQIPLGSQFYTDALVESKLGLNPAGHDPAPMPAVKLISQSVEEEGAQKFFINFYADILSDHRPLPDSLKERLLSYVDLSVRESVSSALLKCQNVSPCRAIATNPILAAIKFDRNGKNDEYGPMACACHIGQQHQWLTGTQNVGLGIVSATAVLVATVYPVNWVVLLAYGLAAADAGGVIAGLDDVYKNVSRTNQVALFRAGGAVPPLYEFDIQNDYANQKYNGYISIITSVLSLAPPARILSRPAGATARDVIRTHEFAIQSKMEFGKTALSISPPDTGWKAYEVSTDPRNDLAPISPLLRERYPKFAAQLDDAASLPTDTSFRDRDFRIARLKKETREKISSGQVVN